MERVNLSEMTVPDTQKITKRICFNQPQVLVFVLTIGPGKNLPPHKHAGSAVVLHLHSGSGIVVADGNETPAWPGDVLYLDGNELLEVRNTGAEPLVLLVSLSPNPTDPAFSQPHG